MSKTIKDASCYSDLAIFECGIEECIKEKVIVLTKKDYHLFHYVYAGKGTLILNNQKYELGKGQIFYIPPQTDAVYYSEFSDPWSYEWIGFDGTMVNSLLTKLDVDINHPIIRDESKKYKNYFAKISSRYVDNGFIDLFSLGVLYQLFNEMLSTSEIDKDIQNAKVTIQLAKDFIHNNYQFKITILDIAKNAHVTPNYLSYLFQKEEGMSTKAYLTKVRMEKSLTLIKTKQFKIKEVALMVGYSNQLHFANEFKKYFGYSPTHYLKND